MSEKWNLGDGLENVCRSAMRKLYYASHQTEERTRTIINLDSYEITALILAMRDYLHNKQFDKRHKDCPLVEVQAAPFDKSDDLETLERIRSGKGLLPIVNALED